MCEEMKKTVKADEAAQQWWEEKYIYSSIVVKYNFVILVLYLEV